MATFNNGESLSSVRTKINDAIDKIDGNATIPNNVDITGTLTSDGLTVDGNVANITLNNTDTTIGQQRLSEINFDQNDPDGAGVGTVASIYALNRGASSGFGALLFQTGTASSLADRMRIDYNGDITFYDTSGNASFVYSESAGSTFNEQGDNKDFRVESDSVANMFFVDASTNRIGINTNAPTTDVDIVGQGANFADIKLRDVAGRVLEIKSPSDSSEATIATTTNHNLEIHAGAGGATNYITFKTDTVERLEISSNSVIFNDTGADTDFRVESDGNENMLFVDAGENAVKIGGTTTREGALQVFTTASGVAMEIESTDGSASQGPILQLRRTSSSPAGNDYLGALNFVGQDSGDNALSYVDMYTRATTITDGSEESQLSIRTRRNGTLEERVTVDSVQTTFNEVGGNTDFRVESDGNANMLFVDAQNDHVNIGTATDLTGVLNVDGNVALSGNGTGTRYLALLSENDTYAGRLLLQAGAGSTGYGGSIAMYGHSHASKGGDVVLGISAGSGGQFRVHSGGTDTGTDRLTIGENGEFVTFPLANNAAVFNQAGVNADFRVESDSNANMLVVDAGENCVSVGTSDTSVSGLHVVSSGTGAAAISARGNGAANGMVLLGDRYTDDENQLTLGIGYANASVILARGCKPDPTGTNGFVSSQDTYANRPTALSIQDGGLTFYSTTTSATTTTNSAVTLYNYFEMDTAETVFNEFGGNRDFRVESDTNPHALYVDAGNGNVGINTSATGSTLAELTVGKAGDFPVLKISRTDASYTSGVLALGDGNGTAVNVAVWRGNQNDYSAGGNYLNLHGYQGVSIASANATAGSGTMGVFVSPSATVINEDGADYDFRVESDSNDHMLFVDAGNDRVGIKNSAPQHPLSVNGTTQILAGANNTGSIANGATADVITSVPRGFSYVNVSYSSTATGGLLLLLYTTTASTTIVSTISDQSGGAFSASVSGRALRATNSSGSAATLYASCMTLAWGTGD